MTKEESKMLVELHTNMNHAMEMLARHEKDLHGNGQPGLCDRMTKMESSKATMIMLAGGCLSLLTTAGTWIGIITFLIP